GVSPTGLALALPPEARCPCRSTFACLPAKLVSGGCGYSLGGRFRQHRLASDGARTGWLVVEAAGSTAQIWSSIGSRNDGRRQTRVYGRKPVTAVREGRMSRLPTKYI